MNLVRRPTDPTGMVLLAVVICIGSFMIDAPTACADELRPQSTVGNFVKNLNPLNWKMPKMQMPKMPSLKSLLPGQSEKDRIRMRKDNLVQEVANSAKRSWEKTKHTFNPKRLIPAGFMDSGRESGGVQQAGFFSSLLGGGEPEVTTPQSVNDFLKNNRPMN